MFTELSVILLAILTTLLLGSKKSFSNNSNVSVVIPAFNEEKSIKHVIDIVKQVKQITQIIVVDDGSTDNTYNIISNENVNVLRHKKNKGKGAAMKTGLKEVTNDIVLFLDADLSEINKSQVEAIIKPILNGEADITKTKFKREAGRVTELTAKPLLQFFFPEVSFEQPLSGQFAVIRSFLDNIDLERDYGVDIGIILDADAQGMRIQEVDIGDIVHEMSSLQELNIMANEVVRTIVDRAINYGKLTMIDDLGNAIRMELMGLTIITFGIFGLFFIQPMNVVVSGLVILIGIIISLFYIYKLIKKSIRVYRQSKMSTTQLIKSFVHMHFPVVISFVILFVIILSLLGSVNISSNEISIEPVTKNFVISSSSPSSSGVSVRGPYTVESALENEEHLIRLPVSALNTLNTNYGDYVYINDERYQLEQAINNETNIIRIPESARDELGLSLEEVIRDSDLRGVFENKYIVKNIRPDPNQPAIANNSTNESISFNNTNVSVGQIITTTPQPEKILNVYVNNTLISSSTGFMTNTSHTIYINNVRYTSIDINTTTTGEIYNTTYKNSTILVELKNGDYNSTNFFVDDNGYVKFLNINII